MAFPNGWERKCSLMIQASGVNSDLTDFPVLLTKDVLPLEMFDADGSYPALNGGGDIRFSSDSDGSIQLACEVVTFSTDNDPNNGKAEIWVNLPTVNSGIDTTFYVWYNKAGETQPTSSSTYGSENVWNSNFKMVQHMEDTTTSTISDSTSNANDGAKIAANEPIESDGKVGKAQNFDGSNDYIDCGNDVSLQPSSEVSLSAWIKLAVLGSRQEIVTNEDKTSDPSNGYNLRIGSSNIIQLRIGTSSATNLTEGGTTLSQDTQYYIAVTYDGSVGKVYLNGIEDGSSNFSGAIDEDTADTNIGRRIRTDYPDYLKGLIDELHISNIAHSAAWVKAEFNNQNSPSTFVIEGTSEDANILYYYSGYVFEQNNPVSRKLYLHNRSTGELVAITTSSGNGYYYMETAFSGSHYIVCLDDVAGVEYNDLIIGPAFSTIVSG